MPAVPLSLDYATPPLAPTTKERRRSPAVLAKALLVLIALPLAATGLVVLVGMLLGYFFPGGSA